jgi:DNA uptake protein ComE-like DNA-binding protein
MAIKLTCDGNYSFKTNSSDNHPSGPIKASDNGGDVIDLISDDDDNDDDDVSLSQDDVCAIEAPESGGEKEEKLITGTLSTLVAEANQRLVSSGANVQSFVSIKRASDRSSSAEKQALERKKNQQKEDEMMAQQRRMFGGAQRAQQPVSRGVNYASFRNLLNSWTIQQLKRELEGVGPTTARNILTFRIDSPFSGTTEAGIFAELQGVNGIGQALARKIMDSLVSYQGSAGGGGGGSSSSSSSSSSRGRGGGGGSSHGMTVEARRRHVQALTAQLIGLQARTGGGRGGRGRDAFSSSLVQGILHAVAARRR